MEISRKFVAQRLIDHLHGRLSLAELVDWAELAMCDADFDAAATRDVTARLGLSDVRAFGLTWDDCRRSLATLGYSARVEVVA